MLGGLSPTLERAFKGGLVHDHGADSALLADARRPREVDPSRGRRAFDRLPASAADLDPGEAGDGRRRSPRRRPSRSSCCPGPTTARAGPGP